jgi:hypothetical protein
VDSFDPLDLLPPGSGYLTADETGTPKIMTVPGFKPDDQALLLKLQNRLRRLEEEYTDPYNPSRLSTGAAIAVTYRDITLLSITAGMGFTEDAPDFRPAVSLPIRF